MKGKYYGVGVGPGDPELITLKAAERLRQSRVVAVPRAAGEQESLAYRICRVLIPREAAILELVFPMSRDNAAAEAARDKAARQVEEYLDRGEDVSVITLGDPTVYSTFMYIHTRLAAAGYRGEIIPGVPSFCAAAAAAGISLAEGREAVAILPFAGGAEDISAVLDRFDTAVWMKPRSGLSDLHDVLSRRGDRKAWAVSRCGLEGQQIHEYPEQMDKDMGYFTTIVIKKRKE